MSAALPVSLTLDTLPGWPAFLVYLDHTLPDHEADEHFIVKFGRGDDPRLADILRLEAPYMQLAAMLGLNVHRPLTLVDRALFMPRFDRALADGIVLRHGQESVAAFCELDRIRCGAHP